MLNQPTVLVRVKSTIDPIVLGNNLSKELWKMCNSYNEVWCASVMSTFQRLILRWKQTACQQHINEHKTLPRILFDESPKKKTEDNKKQWALDN